MKERPILFSGAMVRALLAGTKTQTRRIVKPHLVGDSHWEPVETVFWYDPEDSVPISQAPRFCPYGQPGDRLWVRETWRTGVSLDRYSPKKIAALAREAGYETPPAPLLFCADQAANGDKVTLRDFGNAWGKTRVSIHMPRWASRITLEVTEVRAQRLQEISEEDARAEGCAIGDPYDNALIDPETDRVIQSFTDKAASARDSYYRLWEKLHGAGSWAANPWVWALSVRRVVA